MAARSLRYYLFVMHTTLAQYHRSIPQRHQGQLSTVHLAGLSIITCTHTPVRVPQQQHNKDVLIHALVIPVTPAVMLSTGIGMSTRRNAGYISRVIHVNGLMATRILKSSGDVTLRQVGLRDMSECSFVELCRSIRS